MLILKIHPIIESVAIVLAFYAAFLGYQRLLSLHFGRPSRFRRDIHATVGAVALVTIMSGIAAAKIILARFDPGKVIKTGIHGDVAMVLLPFLLFSLFTGFYMYLAPTRRKILPLLHAISGLTILALSLFQGFSGIRIISTLP